MTAAQLRRAAIKERERRARANRLKPPSVDIDQVFHAPQARLVRSIVERRRRFIDANCGRQSGKSHGCGGATNLVASGTPGVNTLYVTKTFASCEKMAFKPASKLCADWKLGGRPRSGRTLDIVFPNGSTSYYMGADTEGTIEKLRGTPNLALVVIDEAGLYDPDDLKLMIEAVTPGLRPLAGTLVVAGTPSRAGKQGTWWDITQNPHFDHHYFDYRDNDRVPSFAEVERLIDEELAMMFPLLTPEQRRETAYFKREYLAQFEVDLAEKVYQLTNDNLVDDVGGPYEYHCTAGDLGVSANDSLVCGGWNQDSGGVYIVDQDQASGQDTLEYAKMVKAHNAKRGPLAIVVDAGGLGSKTIKTVKAMHPTIPIEEAVKPPIPLQVRALNELLQGAHGWRLYVKRGSPLALHLARPTWVDGLVGGEIDEHGQHSDLVPPARYLAIKIRQYLGELAPPPTPEEAKRAAYLAGIEKAVKNRTRRQGGNSGYEAEEFADDLDLEQEQE